jgi:hypothetical protein
MAPSSSFCVSLFLDFEEMLCASGDDHKWRTKCKELEKDTEAMVLLRLLVAQDDDLQDMLMKRSRFKLRTMCGSRTGGWPLPGVLSD